MTLATGTITCTACPRVVAARPGKDGPKLPLGWRRVGGAALEGE